MSGMRRLLDLREHAELIFDFDGAELAVHLGAQQFTLIAAAASIDLGNNEAALTAQIPIPIDLKALRDQLGPGRSVARCGRVVDIAYGYSEIRIETYTCRTSGKATSSSSRIPGGK